MKTVLLLLAVGMLLVGCESRHDHNLFKPEIPDATFASPGRTEASEVKADLETSIKCPGTEYGHSPCVDMDGTFEGWGFVNEDVVLAAPKFPMAKADPDPTEDAADSDGGLNKSSFGDPNDTDYAGDPTADD